MRNFTVIHDGKPLIITQDDDGAFIIPDGIRPLCSWGTALKPAWEPIVLARKPLIGTVAENAIEHGTGALNIDGCRVSADEEIIATSGETTDPTCHEGYQRPGASMFNTGKAKERGGPAQPLGRWPANVITDGSDEVLAAFPEQVSGGTPPSRPRDKTRHTYGAFGGQENPDGIGSTAGNAARFFYSAKADGDDRFGSKHPTVKPIDLMAYLCRLITPPGGVILDPFAGSGTTGAAAMREGFRAILIEREAEYVADIHARLEHLQNGERHSASIKNRKADPKKAGGEDTPLFGGSAA